MQLMDKEWMSKDRLSVEYRVGVESFMHYASENVDINNMSCPCAKCGNLRRTTSTRVKAHLMCNGVDRTYHIWVWHGEKSNRYSTSESGQVGKFEDTNHPNESLDDMIHAAYENTKDVDELIEIFADAEKPLYPGCTKFTKLSAILKLYNLKTKYGWSEKSLTDLLSLFKDMLPENNELPLSLYEAKRSLVGLGMNYNKIDACPNDCILYRKAYEDHTNCPTCGASRWKMGKNLEVRDGVPAKVLWYFPPIPRFQRMFRNKEVSKDLTWHNDERVSDSHMRHPTDSPCWRTVDHKWKDFAEEPRNLRLALSADGINPHGNMSSTYSCWPIILVTYNLPPQLCMKRKFMMLTLLISGPKQPGNDIDVYLAPLIDDLQSLWVGVDAYDAYRNEKFLLRAVLLWTINDFPAYGNLSGNCVKGYLACPVCSEGTNARRLKHSKKMSYTYHRRYLPYEHPFRRQKKAFDGTQDFDPPPHVLNGSEVLSRVARIKCKWGKMRRNPKPKENEEKLCWKKKSIFFDLEYWEHLHVRHVLDVMHIEKNVCESLIGTLLDIPGKTKDGLASRCDLVEMKVRDQLAPAVEKDRIYIPAACYTLSREEKQMVCKSLSAMKVPTGYSSNISNLVSMKDLKLVGLKSHDCHTLMQQLLPIAIRGVLPDNVRYTITKLCLFFNQLCSKVIDVSKLDDMQREIVITLCELEKYFPPSFFDIMIHLMVHLVRELRLCGPVWYRWMYPFERYMKVLKGYVRNRNHPEGCMAECYIAEEAVEFASDHLRNMNTAGLPQRPERDELTKPLSNPKVHILTRDELHQAHLHVLTNDVEIDPYINEHMEQLRSCYTRKPQKWLHDQHNKLFISWLSERVVKERKLPKNQISERVIRFAQGPNNKVLKYQSYSINGVTYHTKERDSVRATQNSGVSLVAKTLQLSSAKDKNPVIADMVFYGVIEEIWELDYSLFRIPLLKCIWVDNRNGCKVDDFGFTLVNLKKIGYKNDSFILGSLAKKVFYIDDPKDSTWSVVLATPNRDYFDYSNDGECDETSIHHQCFTKGLHENNLDTSDDYEPPLLRKDCERIWIENTNT